jgi:hypothetical protein
VKLVVVRLDISLLIDPTRPVTELPTIGCGDVDPDVDGELRFFGCFLETEDKGTGLHREGKGDRFLGIKGYIVLFNEMSKKDVA